MCLRKNGPKCNPNQVNLIPFAPIKRPHRDQGPILFLKKEVARGGGGERGSSWYNLFSHFHHFTAEPQRLRSGANPIKFKENHLFVPILLHTMLRKSPLSAELFSSVRFFFFTLSSQNKADLIGRTVIAQCREASMVFSSETVPRFLLQVVAQQVLGIISRPYL
jgi:hypothetical protein